MLNYLGKRSTWMRVKRLLTVTYVPSIIKLLIMCFIWMRNFFSSVRLSLLCVIFDIMKLKRHSKRHIFHKCSFTETLWNQLLFFFLNRCWLSWFNTAGCPFSFINQSENNLNTLQNHTLLIFKLYIYQSRERGVLKVHQCRYENLPTYSFSYENNMFKIIRSFTFWDMRAWHVWKVCLQTFRNNTIC